MKPISAIVWARISAERYTEVPERTEKAGVTEPHQGQLPDEPGKGTGL